MWLPIYFGEPRSWLIAGNAIRHASPTAPQITTGDDAGSTKDYMNDTERAGSTLHARSLLAWRIRTGMQGSCCKREVEDDLLLVADGRGTISDLEVLWSSRTASFAPLALKVLACSP